MAPSLPRAFYPFLQGLWKGVSPGHPASQTLQKLCRIGQQQLFDSSQSLLRRIPPPGASTTSFGPILSSRPFASSSRGRAILIFPRTTGVHEARFISISSSSGKATSEKMTELSGKMKTQEEAYASKGGLSSDQEAGTRSHPEGSLQQRSTNVTSGDFSAAFCAAPEDALQGGLLGGKGMSQQRVVHSTLISPGKGSAEAEGKTKAGGGAFLDQTDEQRKYQETERTEQEDYLKIQERPSGDFSTHPPSMRPVDPDVLTKRPPLSPGESPGKGTAKEEDKSKAGENASLDRTDEQKEHDEAERIAQEDYWKLQERISGDFSTHPPYMYPMDPEMMPKGPPLSPRGGPE